MTRGGARRCSSLAGSRPSLVKMAPLWQRLGSGGYMADEGQNRQDQLINVCMLQATP
jgi:hypothetical protein